MARICISSRHNLRGEWLGPPSELAHSVEGENQRLRTNEDLDRDSVATGVLRLVGPAGGSTDRPGIALIRVLEVKTRQRRL